MSDAYVRIADLRYMEQQMSQLLRLVVAHEPAPPKEVSERLCGIFSDHDRHYIALDAVLRDAGQEAHEVSEPFRRETDERLRRVGAADTAEQVVAEIGHLEAFAAEEYAIAAASASAELRGLLCQERDEERSHAQFLEAWVRSGGRVV
jgi:hypothetical protein